MKVIIMEIEFLETKENPLLERTEIRFRVKHPDEPTVSRNTVRDKIASLTKASRDKVILDGMNSKFGLCQTDGYVKVYKTVEAAKKHEREHILIRNGLLLGENESTAKKNVPAAQPQPEKQ